MSAAGDLERQPARRVRRAAPDEAAAVAAVLRDAFAEYAAVYTPEAFAVTAPTADAIRDRWGDGPVWVALCDGRVVGTVAAVPEDGAVYVRSMAVVPTGRGHGTGRLLLDEAERFAQERGCRRLYLSTTPFLDRAIRLYEQCGFQRTADGPHELFGTPLFTMVKRLE